MAEIQSFSRNRWSMPLVFSSLPLFLLLVSFTGCFLPEPYRTGGCTELGGITYLLIIPFGVLFFIFLYLYRRSYKDEQSTTHSMSSNNIEAPSSEVGQLSSVNNHISDMSVGVVLKFLFSYRGRLQAPGFLLGLSGLIYLTRFLPDFLYGTPQRLIAFLVVVLWASVFFVKRLHDHNMTGFWYVPIALSFLGMMFTDNFFFVFTTLTICIFVIPFFFIFSGGTVGKNRFDID